MQSAPEFTYRLKKQTERLSARGQELSIEIESLANLNETIDELFVALEKTGNARLLEDLCPYFGVVWPSARALAGYLFEQAPLAGISILEVGCGLALPSLAAVRLGAEVVATDFHPEVPRFLERNLALNTPASGTFRYVSMDWQKASEELGRFDWVIGSDILYERQHPPHVAAALARHVRPGGKIVLADPGRPYLQGFVDEMLKLGLRYEMLTRIIPDDPQPKEIFLLVFEARP